MTLKQIAAGISAHLKRFEADPKINATDETYGTRDFYHATAYASARYVHVVYVTYQGASHMPKDAAMDYLNWLDGGNVGRHYELQ